MRLGMLARIGKFFHQRNRIVHRRRLRVELLESRNLLATFTVTTTADTVNAADGVVSLREAIGQANATTAADVINFDPVVFAGAKTIELALGQLQITESLTINGTGATRLTIDGMEQSRVLDFPS